MKKVFLISFLLLIGFNRSAHAYFDPGTGSLIVQIIVGAIATIAVFFKQILNSIKGFFKKGNKDNSELK